LAVELHRDDPPSGNNREVALTLFAKFDLVRGQPVEPFDKLLLVHIDRLPPVHHIGPLPPIIAPTQYVRLRMHHTLWLIRLLDGRLTRADETDLRLLGGIAGRG
jgi:hypothetical protein